MEEKLTNETVVVDEPTAVAAAVNDKPNENANVEKKKKQRFSLFKTAMVMLGSRPRGKPKATKVATIANDDKISDSNESNENWKKVVGSMRPMHMQDCRSPPPKIRPITSSAQISDQSEDENFSTSPYMSTTSWGTMSHSVSVGNLHELAGSGGMRHTKSTSNLQKLSGNMSRYASALNLHDLDVDEEDEADDDGDNVFENYPADVMIDSKANKFIAQFYDQMNRQQKKSRELER